MPPGKIVFEGAEVEDGLGFFVEGVEVFTIDGPAAMGYPVAFFEAIKQRIKRCDMEADGPAGAKVDERAMS